MTKLIVAFHTFSNAPKNAYVFLASKEAGLEVNAEKRLYLHFLWTNAILNHNLRIANKAFENVAKFTHLGKKLTNQKRMNEGIMSSRIRGMCVSVRSKIFCLRFCCLRIYRIYTEL